MRYTVIWRRAIAMLLVAAIATGGEQVAHAVTATSPNYQMTEMQFNSGTSLDSCSDEYCARASIGDLAAGDASSPGQTSASFGSVTTDEPLLEVIVDPGPSNLGILQTNSTATKESVIRVRNYLSSGYMLQIVGEPPTYDGHALDSPAAPTTSQPGTEQFGINLVANTTPGIGAAPVQVPSGEMSFGEVEPAYRTANQFKFNSGDVVARSERESGRTDYTVSMIINVSNNTPAGHYSGDLSAVVIPIF